MLTKIIDKLFSVVMISATLSVIAGAIFGIGQLFYQFDKKECRDSAHKMDVVWDHGFWTGCRYELNGRFVDRSDFRITDELLED